MIIIQASFSDEPTPDLFRASSTEETLSPLEKEFHDEVHAIHRKFLEKKKAILAGKFEQCSQFIENDIPIRGQTED